MANPPPHEALAHQLTQLEQAIAQQQSYNHYWQAQKQLSVDEQQRLSRQLQSLQKTRDHLPPLMMRIVERMEAQLRTDMPFYLESRTQSLASLRETLLSPETGLDTKLRALLAELETEARYGGEVKRYVGTLEWQGEARQATYLRIGRLAWFAWSQDGQHGWYWQPKGWQPLPEPFLAGLRQAEVQLAGESLPALVPVPLLPPLEVSP